MDYSKYENRKKYPSLSEEKAYKMTLEGQVYKLTATGEEIKKMLDDIPNKVKEWKNKMEKANNHYYWIFARETDYFIIGNSYEREDKGIISESIFVRTIDGEWYSIGNYWDNGLLIVK